MLEQFFAPIYRILIIAFAYGLLSAFWISVASISGLREYLEVRANKIFYNLISCDFCLSFWVLVILSGVSYFFIADLDCVLIPFLATPISRYLLKW